MFSPYKPDTLKRRGRANKEIGMIFRMLESDKCKRTVRKRDRE